MPAVTGGDVERGPRRAGGAGLRLGGRASDFDDAAGRHRRRAGPRTTAPCCPAAPVDVVVSLGPEPVEVPAVFERRFDDAAAALEGLGFVVERRGSDVFGRVVSQDPSAGTLLPPGSTVVLTTF